jgi:hypothetical protein
MEGFGMLPLLPRPLRPLSSGPQFPARFIVLIVITFAVTALVISGMGVMASLGVVVAAALTAEAICDRLDPK